MEAKLGDESAEGKDPEVLAIPQVGEEDPLGRPSDSRILGLLRWTRQLTERPTLRPWLLAIAAAIFLILALSSFRSLPDETPVRPVALLVLVMVATPVTLILNALEYRIMAAALGHRVGMRSALHISLIASIANYLPAPGGIAVRTAALRRRGSPVRSAISVNIVAGLVWLGLTAIVAGVALLAVGELASRATVAIAAGIVLVVVASALLRRERADWPGLVGQLTAIELATVLVSATRTWIALAAIGQAPAFGSATAISASSVLAALLGVFPAGLGLRELLAGGLAAVVDVSTAHAIAATSVDRVAGQIGMGITALASGIRWSDLRQPKAQPK